MANPGPASTITSNQQSLLSNQALRLIGVVKGCSVSAAGDVLMPVLSATSFVPATVITSNSITTATGASVSVATATLGIYTAAAQGGTAILTTAALTSQASSTYAKVQAATAAATVITVNAPANLYVNIGTTVAGAQTDVYLYGYDVS